MSKAWVVEIPDEYMDFEDWLKKVEENGYKKGRAEIQPLVKEIHDNVSDELYNKGRKYEKQHILEILHDIDTKVEFLVAMVLEKEQMYE